MLAASATLHLSRCFFERLISPILLLPSLMHTPLPSHHCRGSGSAPPSLARAAACQPCLPAWLAGHPTGAQRKAEMCLSCALTVTARHGTPPDSAWRGVARRESLRWCVCVCMVVPAWTGGSTTMPPLMNRENRACARGAISWTSAETVKQNNKKQQQQRVQNPLRVTWPQPKRCN